MFNKTIRSALSLLLVFCLLFGMSGNAIAMAIGDSASRAVDKIDKEVENIIADLRGSIANLDAQVKEQETTLNKGKTELAKAEATLVAAEAELEQAKADLLIYGGTPEMLAKVDEAMAKVDAAQADVDEAKKLVDEAEKTLDQANTTIADANEAVDNVEKTYEDLYAALADPNASLTYVEETVKELRTNVDALWQSVLDLETSVDNLIEAYAALENAQTDAVEVPKMPEKLTKLDEALDTTIAIVITLNEALDYFVAAAEKVLEVTEGALRRIYRALKDNLSRDMHQKVYNWLYNNPDQVCDLVEKFGVFGLEKLVQYGPYALELLNNHYDLAVIGMKVTLGAAYLTKTLGAKALGYLGNHIDFINDYPEYVAKAASKLYAKYGDEAKALLKVYVEYLDLQDRYNNATNADYTIYNDSKLLVIGDRSAASGYAALLADMLYKNENFNTSSFFDSTVDMKTDWANTTESVLDQLNDWAGLVGNADLITVGFGNMNAVREMIDGLLSEKFEKDWSDLVGDGVAELIENTLKQMEMEMKVRGISQESIDTVLLAAQHYAYAYAQQQKHYPALINKLQSLNKDAQIVIVGSYNELADITVLVNGNEIAIGNYVQPLIDAANMQSLVEGFLNENVIFVNAPQVTNAGGNMTFNLSDPDDLLEFAFATEDDNMMMPDEASQEYVAKLIFKALTITDKRTSEAPIVPPTTTTPVGPGETTTVNPGEETTVPSQPETNDPVNPPVDECPHLNKFIVHTEQYHFAENCLDVDKYWDQVVCYDCGAEWIIYRDGEKGPHQWTDWYLVEDNGSYSYSVFGRDCKLCGAHQEETFWVDCEHEWKIYEDSYTAQNCLENSWYEWGVECVKCSARQQYHFAYTGKGPHCWTSWMEWDSNTEARQCELCYEWEFRDVDCRHDSYYYVGQDSHYAADCREESYIIDTYQCNYCDKQFQIVDYLGKGPHIYGDWHLADGYNEYGWSLYYRDCLYCDHTDWNWFYKECDHNWEHYEYSYEAKNCWETSYYEWGVYCSECGIWESFDWEYGANGPHYWSDWYGWDSNTDYRWCWYCGEHEYRDADCRHWNYSTSIEWVHASNCLETTLEFWHNTCMDCGYKWTDTYGHGIGEHQFGEWYLAWDFGVNNWSIYERQCELCHMYEHEWRYRGCDHENTYDVFWYHYEATYCYENSYDEYDTYCADCGDYLGWWREYYEVGSQHIWSGWYECFEHENCRYRFCWSCGAEKHETYVTCDHENTYDVFWWHYEATYCYQTSYDEYDTYCADCGSYLGWWREYFENGSRHRWSSWYTCNEHENCSYRYCRYCDEVDHNTYLHCDHKNAEVWEYYYEGNCQNPSYYYWELFCYECWTVLDWYEEYGDFGDHSWSRWRHCYEHDNCNYRYCRICGEEQHEGYDDCHHNNTYAEMYYQYNAYYCWQQSISYWDVWCADCGMWIDWYYVIGETGSHHEMGDWYVSVEPTETTEGELRRECWYCDYHETKRLPATGTECAHDYMSVIENIVDADCVNPGSYDEVIYCVFCGEELYRETIITDALGHAFGDWKLHKLPTCTERGELRRYCDRCDCFESFELPALNEFDIDVPDYRDEIMDLIRKIYNFLGDEVFNLMSTSGNYTVDCDSLYVAIGDSTALSGGYAEMLAEMLKVPNMENLAQYGLTISDAINMVAQNADLIANADLITLGFSNLAASEDMLNALNGMYNADWSDAIGQTAAKAVEKALAELKQQLIKEGYDAETVAMILDAANTYAYAYAARALRYPALVEAVREVNPNALIVIVGAYNDLQDVVVEINGHDVNIGKLTEYLIYAANFENMLQAVYGENMVYAHAPAVETVFDTMNYENLNNLGYLMSILNDEMLPTDAGHAYIAEEIFKTLNVSGSVHGDLIEVIENIVQPDCVNGGSYDKVIYCANCGVELHRETFYVDALGHNFGCWQIHKFPTLSQEGELRRYCDRCGCYESIMLPNLWKPDFDFDFDYRDEVMDMIRKLYDVVGDKLFELVEDATHGDYTIFHDSLYVAIGDSTALSHSYVDELAELLEIPHMMQNLAQPGLTVGDAIDLVGENADLISKADLITLGFSNIAASVDMLNALNGMYTADWSDAVGETAAETINKALADLKLQLIADGMDDETVNMVLDAANAYAYAFAARAMRYPALVEAVREVNPNALIVLVGTYNDLEGVVVDVNGSEVNIGKYAEYLIYAANLENLLQAIHGENIVYVHAPDVETIFEENDYQNLNNLGYLMSILNDEMLPSEAGNKYIAEKIFEALTVKYCIWGDVNGDRKVDCRDARLILRYRAGLITENDLDLTWADVNGDGRVDARDARWILRVRADLEQHFPVCP